MASSLDVMNMAFRRVGIVAQDEIPTADEYTAASELLDSIYAEVNRESPLVWTIEDVPNEALLPLAMLLSYDLALAFGRPPVSTRGMAMLRLLSVVRPDDREEIAQAEYY